MRALVVDDFVTMRRVVRSLLRETGFADADIVEASNGAAALERLRDEAFDVVVTDIEMPTLGGFELLSAIRRDARWRHLPVLMVTAEARKDEIVRCTHAGATAYLVKPFSRAVLAEKLRAALPAASFAADERASS
ncbi:MAG: response regulator [Rhizobacter sp.]|nr:response regulator [Rhizobacter sp.]